MRPDPRAGWKFRPTFEGVLDVRFGLANVVTVTPEATIHRRCDTFHQPGSPGVDLLAMRLSGPKLHSYRPPSSGSLARGRGISRLPAW
jgi:hypothetical protein